MTGWARRNGVTYLVPVPAPRESVQRLNTRDRTIEAAIFLLNAKQVRTLKAERDRLTERAWTLHTAARTLIEAALAWRGR